MEQKNSSSYENPWNPQPELEALNQLVRDLPKILETKIRLEHVFSSIHHKMSAGIETHEILNSIFDSLEKIIPFDRIGIALLENQRKEIRLKWVKSKLNSNRLAVGYTAPLESSGLKNVIFSDKPRIINDLEIYLAEHPNSLSTKLILEDGIRSNLTCPLVLNGSPIGVIFFASARPYTYAKIHVDIFCEISQGLSIIIAQGILKDSLKKIDQKEKMFLNILHDLNNPLWVIQTTLDMVTKKAWFKELGEDSQKFFTILRRNCDSMIRLVQQMVYTVSEEKPGIAPSSENVLMQSFVTEVQEDALAIAKKKDIHVLLELHRNLPSLLNFDQHAVKQVLGNLLVNAVKYSNQNSSIILKMEYDKSNKQLHFMVSDKGPGIPQNILQKIFQERILAEPGPKVQSSGRGLLNVKRLIHSLKGEVSVQSKLGAGASFTFWIPVNEPADHFH